MKQTDSGRRTAVALRYAQWWHRFLGQPLEGEPRRMLADGCVLWSWHRAAVHISPVVVLPCGLRGWLRTWIQGQKGKKQRNKMEHSSFGIQCQGKESFSVGCSYKIRRDKVKLLKYLFSQVHAELSEDQTHPLIKTGNFPRTIYIGTK